LVDDARWRAFEGKREAIGKLQGDLKQNWIRVGSAEAELAENYWGSAMQKEANLLDMLRRPEVTIDKLLAFLPSADDIAEAVAEQVEIQAKYAGYIVRQEAEIEKTQRYDHLRLPEAMDYSKVSGLSNEVSQKLAAQRPETLGQASRIPGMTPAAISLLLIYMKKKSA
jgi:tRNA uridine 5-carboxymethylaminomethyl modification enzyme